MKIHKDITEILFTPEQIQSRVKEIADKISKDYSRKSLMFVSILRGSVIFLSDLIRYLKISCSMDFVAISSYSNGIETSGVVRQLLDLRQSPVGQNIIIVEDIVDTGYTLAYLRSNLSTRSPKSLKICAFLNKKSQRKIKIPIDYCGFVVPNKFVVGYGLDYMEKYRNLPYVGVLNPKIYMGKK